MIVLEVGGPTTSCNAKLGERPILNASSRTTKAPSLSSARPSQEDRDIQAQSKVLIATDPEHE